VQGASVDPSGRLRVVDSAPSSDAVFNGGIAFEPDGRMCIVTAGIPPVGDPYVGGFKLKNDGRVWVATTGGAVSAWNKAMPFNSVGQLLGYLDTIVPPLAAFNDGIAMGQDGVFMTTTPAPPAPTTRFNLMQFPLDPRINFIRNSIGTYWDENGILKTAVANEPRPYRDPETLAILGLMIEEAATNVFTWSDDFTNAAWTKVQMTFTDPVVAPDGVSTAWRLVAAAGVNGYIYRPYPATAGQPQTYSCEAWYDGGAYTTVGLYAEPNAFSDALARTCRFNLVTGQITQVAGGAIAKIEKAPNGKWIISMTFTPDVTISSAVQIRNFTAGNGVDGFYVWGADFCAENQRSSHIPTRNGVVTRQVDNPSVIGANFSDWYNQSEGTIICRAMTYDNSSGAINNYPFALNDGTVNNRILAFLSGASLAVTPRYTAGGISTNPTISATAQVNSEFTIGMAYSVGAEGCNVAFNGLLGSPSLPAAEATIDRLEIGINIGTELLNGYVAYIDYWNTRLPNNQLQELSQWGYQGAS
jgi:hypothetical protein